MSRKVINPENLFDSTAYGFSQITIGGPGKHVFISGQVAWDENFNVVGGARLEAQTRKALENLQTAIEAAGGALADIVMLRIYKVKYEKGDGPVIGTVLKEFFGTENPPSSTWISVEGLANEDFLIEIEAQAIVAS